MCRGKAIGFTECGLLRLEQMSTVVCAAARPGVRRCVHHGPIGASEAVRASESDGDAYRVVK